MPKQRTSRSAKKSLSALFAQLSPRRVQWKTSALTGRRAMAALGLLLVVALVGIGLLGTSLVSAPAKGPSAGLRSFRYPIATLPRPIDASAWYPAARGALERPVWYSSAAWGRAAVGAPIADGPKLPLIVLAHGWRGTRFDMGWLGEALARRGYVAASLDMPEVDAKTFDDAQAPKVWYRAQLLRGLIDAVAKNPSLAAHADTHHVVVIGHSAGGSAAFMLGGAELDPARFNSLFPLSAPVVDGDWDDERLAGIVALNPGTGPAFSPKGLAHVHVPALILSGTGDVDAPEPTNAGYYAKYVPKAQWHSFANVNHYTFNNICSTWAMLRGFGTCRESTTSVHRDVVHAKALVAIENFLARLQAPKRRHH